MAEKIRVLIQMRHTPDLSAAALSFRPASIPALARTQGFTQDTSFSPVQLPRRERRGRVGPREVGRLFSFDARPEVSTYLIRGEVEDEDALARLTETIQQDPDGVGVFSDPRISAIAVCPRAPVGNHRDVEDLLGVTVLHNRGMDGRGVMVAIVDNGVNMEHLRSKGMNPGFDAAKSWSPVDGQIPGDMPVDHGTMCAFDVCISAPHCTILDYALLQSEAEGGSAMDGFLSDAVRAYNQLLTLMIEAGDSPPALVVNNSWGMFHPSWDFPVDHSGNYSDNPDHPFNIIVESLEDAGADILFAAGNCGAECPDGRCEDATSEGIFGANSSSSVLCIAGVTINKVRLGYSTQGPGRLDPDKPDLCAYTHFLGSEAFGNGTADSGTSAACPVAAGVVAAIRSAQSPSVLPPAQLRNLLRRSADDIGLAGFDYDHGFGLIDSGRLLEMRDRAEVRPLSVGQEQTGRLPESNASVMFKITVGNALNIALDGPAGVDFDIYVRKGQEPTLNEYDYRGYTSSADEKIRVTAVEPGDYYVMVRSYRGSGDFVLRTTLE